MGAARVEIPILSATAGDHVHVDVQWSDQGVTAPPATSILWRTIAEVPVGDLPETVTTEPVPRGFYLWYRSSAWENGVRVSNFSDPVAVEIPELAEISAANLHVDDGGAVAQWDENDLVDSVLVRWSMHADGDDPDWSVPTELVAGIGQFSVPDRPGLGERASVQVTPRDASDAEGTPVEVTRLRPSAYGDAIEPKHWCWTNDGLPLRWSDRRLVRFSALALPDDVYQWSDGRPVRFSDHTLVRSES